MTRVQFEETYINWLSVTDSKPLKVLRGCRLVKVQSINKVSGRILFEDLMGDTDILHYSRLKVK